MIISKNIHCFERVKTSPAFIDNFFLVDQIDLMKWSEFAKKRLSMG